MRVRRLDHVLLAMPAGRETDARNFYSGILGIPEAKKPAGAVTEPGTCLMGGFIEENENKLFLRLGKTEGMEKQRGGR